MRTPMRSSRISSINIQLIEIPGVYIYYLMTAKGSRGVEAMYINKNFVKIS
jgi:hypothetical protein